MGLVIANILYHQYQNSRTGEIAQRFNHLVRRETLVKVAEKILLGKYIFISSSEEKTGGREKSAILADTCEALIAAIYLDGGITPAKKFIDTYWKEFMYAEKYSVKDPKSTLQEWSHANIGVTPEYNEISSSGPSHKPSFFIEVYLPGYDKFIGQGESKRKAQQAAAEALLKYIKYN